MTDTAALLVDDPAERLLAHFRRYWSDDLAAGETANPALSVELIACRRRAGDWLAVLVTPACLRLLLLPGGGSLWGDIPAGQRRYVELVGGTLPFVATELPGIGACQYSTLVAPIGQVPDQVAARSIAHDTLAAFLGDPPAADEAMTALAAPASPPVSRRGFFRRLAGLDKG